MANITPGRYPLGKESGFFPEGRIEGTDERWEILFQCLPDDFFAHVEVDSMMSSTRRRQLRSGGMDGLGEDACLQLLL